MVFILPVAIFHQVLDAVRERSLQSYFRSLIVDLPIAISELLSGLATGGDIDVSNWSKDSTRYQPTPYHMLRVVSSYIRSNDVFVDLGCGKGRVLCFVATRCKLRKAIGVELVPELAHVARRNLSKLTLVAPVRVVNVDAREADLSEGTVYFMYNPFGQDTLRKILQNLKKSLRTNPRRVRLLYYNPKHAHILDDADWIHAVTSYRHRKHTLRVWEN